MRRDLKDDIYEAAKTLERTLRLIKEDKAIAEANRKVILEFVEDGRSRGLTHNRLAICAYHLKRLGRLTKASFKAFTAKDAKDIMKSLEASKYGDWTKTTCKKLFKQLLRFLGRPEGVYEWVKASEPPNKLKKEDLLTPEEVRQLVASAPDNMWRALISILAESGCRPGEALNLTISNVILNADHAKLYVAGKMARSAGERPLFLFKTCDLLKAWLAEHPQKNKLEAPLWITKSTGEPVSLRVLNTVFKRIAKRAGITKRAYPYLLRHCKGTEVYLKYAPALAMKMMGHNDPKTGLVYTHLAEEDVLEALQQEHGLKPKKQEAENVEICQSCGHNNPYGSIQCNNCKAALNVAGAIRIEQESEEELKKLRELKELLADPQIVSVLQALKNPKVLGTLKADFNKS